MITVETVDEYVSSLQVARSTVSNYRSILTAFIKWSREHSYYTLSTAARYYEADLKRTGKVKGDTAKAYAGVVRSFIKWLAEERRCTDFSLTAETMVKKGVFPSLPLKIADADITFICNAAAQRGESGLRGRAIFLLAVTCALTPQQIASIRPRDAEFADDGLWLNIPDGSGSVFSTRATPAACEALRDYLLARGDVAGDLPLVAVTTTKTKRRAMSASDVRKCISGMLDYLGYDLLDVMHGDPERTVTTYLPRLDDAGKDEVSRLVTRLYYENLRIQSCGV